MKKLWLIVILLGACSCLLFGTGSQEPSEQLEGAPTPPAREIVIAVGPVWDNAPWYAIWKLGYLDDLSIAVKDLMPLRQGPALEGLSAGDVDIAIGSDTFALPPYTTLQNIAIAITGDIWYGFSFVVRPDSGIKSYDEFYAELNDHEAAVRATCKQAAGKTFIFQQGWGHDPSVDVLLETGGLTRDDVDFIDMQMTEAATAFIRGEGDIYTGDLPNTTRLLEMGYKQVIGAGELPGPYMLMYINYWMRKEMIANDEPTVLRIMSAWYRVADTLNGPNWKEPLELMRQWVNENSGASFTLEQGRYVQQYVSPWLTFEEAQEKYYAGTPSVWQQRLQFLIEDFEAQGKIEAGVAKVEEMSKVDYLYGRLVELKQATERNVRDITALISGRTGSEADEVRRQLERAQYFFEIRDYVDSEAISSYALDRAREIR